MNSKKEQVAVPTINDRLSLEGERPLSSRAKTALPYLTLAFGSLYILSNILATKSVMMPVTDNLIEFGPVQIWPLVLDGAFVLFPLTYIIDDILSEIYGFAQARKIIIAGFILQIFVICATQIVGLMPSTPDTPVTDDVYFAMFSYMPRIVCASLGAYLVGELLNAWSLIWIRNKTGEKKLWVRLLGSTVVGEAADTITFCTIAFFGTITFGQFLNYTIVGYLVKCGIEVVMLPVTYRIIKYLKG